MLDELLEDELVEIAVWFTEKSISKDELLYSEGDTAVDACFILDGELEVLRALPGGGETRLTTVAPGAMIGEMALVARGTRSASVRALKHSSVLMVSRYFFDAALDQMSAPAFKVLSALTVLLAERRNRLRLQILQEWDCELQEPPVTETIGAQPNQSDPLQASPSFNYRAFLPIISCFKDFTAGEIDRVVERTSVLELARDDVLYREQSPATACYVLVRGALEVSVARESHCQLAILGPGRLAGVNSLLAQTARMNDVRLRTDALLLSMENAAFFDLYLGETVLSMRFQRMVTSNLLQDLRAADNLLTTLVSKSRIRERAMRREI